MEIQRYSEIKKALKSKFNLAVLGLGSLLLIDFVLGSPVCEKIMRFQFELRGITSNFKLFAIFGTFDDIHEFTRRFELVFLSFCFLVVFWSFFKGWLSALRMKT